jgi:hypothetical protein
MQTIPASPPHVHWARKYAAEIGVGLIVLAVIVFGFAVWVGIRALTDSSSPIPISQRPVRARFEGNLDPKLSWQQLPGPIAGAKPGDVIDLEASGEYVWNVSTSVPVQNQKVGPDGTYYKPSDWKDPEVTHPEQFPMPDAPCGGLLMRVGGANGKVYFVGSKARIQNSDGVLQFMVNSRYGWVHENTGKIHLKIEVR